MMDELPFTYSASEAAGGLRSVFRPLVVCVQEVKIFLDAADSNDFACCCVVEIERCLLSSVCMVCGNRQVFFFFYHLED